MSKVEQKFKVDDKVIWKDKQYAEGWHRHTIDSVMTVVSHNIYEDNEPYLIVMDNGVEAWDFRFELYEEKEMEEESKSGFDLCKNPWYIRVENEEQFNLANEWLKENFGQDVGVNYRPYMRNLVNVMDNGEVVKEVLYNCSSDPLPYAKEIKLNFVTTISSVEFPIVEIETEQQKRIRELKATIDSASKQLEELMKETK